MPLQIAWFFVKYSQTKSEVSVLANTRKIMLISSLEKIFPDTDTVETEITSFSMLKNERTSFQFAVEAQKNETVAFFGVISGAGVASIFLCENDTRRQNRAHECRRFLSAER